MVLRERNVLGAGICLSEQWRSLTVNSAEIRAASADLLARVAEAVMDPATQSSAITALAAIAGSIVGGLASFLTTFFTQRHQAHRDLMLREAAHREELYSQFIKEAANVYVDSLDKTLENPASFVGMYSLVAAAEKVADNIIDSYNRPPTTFDDVIKLARESHIDPLKEFTEACREERKAMLKDI
jgi:hypothetical protein